MLIKFFVPGKPKELKYKSSKGHIYCPQEVADLSNYLKNLEQSLEGVIYRNDNQVEEIVAKRIEHPYLEGVEVTIYV